MWSKFKWWWKSIIDKVSGWQVLGIVSVCALLIAVCVLIYNLPTPLTLEEAKWLKWA